jgi:uncharacterized protein
MILYCDTSSLVKLYVAEEYAEEVRVWVAESDIIATCQVALPEMISALTRRFHRGDLDQPLYQQLLTAIRTDWPHLLVLDFDEILAADLAERHALRGFDAVHLAAALRLSKEQRIEAAFTSFDSRLNRAAAAEGLTVLSV